MNFKPVDYETIQEAAKLLDNNDESALNQARKELREAEDLVQYEQEMQDEWEDTACIRAHIYSDMNGIAPIRMWTMRNPEEDLEEFLKMCEENGPIP